MIEGIEGIGLGWGRRAMMRLRGEDEGERDGLWLLALSRLTALYKRHKKGVGAGPEGV